MTVRPRRREATHHAQMTVFVIVLAVLGGVFARPETGVAFLATLADSWRQRPCYLASPDGKATESQRLFRRRQETEIAQDCVVADAVRHNPSPPEIPC